MRKKILILCCLNVFFVLGQSKAKLHSHNDYEQKVPFWTAYSCDIPSIEIDVFLVKDKILVAHEKQNTKPENTIEKLYLDPMQEVVKKETPNQMQRQFLIDIKTDAYLTLEKLIPLLARYDYVQNKTVKIIISGNKPKEVDFKKYPDFITFDFQDLTATQLPTPDKVGLVSYNFSKLSSWNGKGRLIDSDLEKIKERINQAHQWGKPIRFWASPNTKTAYKALSDLNVDYINTDHLFEAATYMKELVQLVYQTKTTVPIYRPTFVSDGKDIPVKNIILLVGDGMGLAQISAGMFANGNELTLMQLKNIGLIKTQSIDDFTTDSAAAGTALSTGKKTKNRYIGVDENGNPIENTTEWFASKGYLSGIVTTDQLTGATPAAFFAHQPERNWNDKIATDFLSSKISFFAAAGIGVEEKKESEFLTAIPKRGFEIISSLSDKFLNRDKVVFFNTAYKNKSSKKEGRNNFLSEAVQSATSFLANKNKSFFLMVEAAMIDSGGHANDTGMIVEEMLDFDTAIAAALKFADKNNETLVLVTADHETGGFTLPQGNITQKVVEGSFTTNDHTAVMVPIFAYGPQSDKFRGVYENTEVNKKIISIFNANEKK